ncbi:MAG: hypothetical protein ABSE42_14420 [Bryobacteraceae bacterium]|jgi:hypothetical protein
MKERSPLYIPCVVLLALSVTLLIAVLAVRFLAWRGGPEGSHIAPAAGVAISQGFVSPGDAGRAPCHLVRFARKGCHWCARRFSGGYDKLEEAALRSGCDSFVVLPYSDDLPPDGPHVPQEILLSAVSYDFAASTPFRGTPSTALAGRDWKVLWYESGVVSPQRAATAIARLRVYLSH